MWTRQIYKFLQIAQSKNSAKTIISKTFIFKDDSEPILWSACCFFSYTFRCEKMEDHKTGDNYNMFFSHKNKKPFNKQSKELHKINNFPACLTNLRTAGRKKKVTFIIYQCNRTGEIWDTINVSSYSSAICDQILAYSVCRNYVLDKKRRHKKNKNQLHLSHLHCYME